jgi:hypothetical protein
LFEKIALSAEYHSKLRVTQFKAYLGNMTIAPLARRLTLFLGSSLLVLLFPSHAIAQQEEPIRIDYQIRETGDHFIYIESSTQYSSVEFCAY